MKQLFFQMLENLLRQNETRKFFLVKLLFAQLKLKTVLPKLKLDSGTILKKNIFNIKTKMLLG